MIIIGSKGSENAMLSACMALIDSKAQREEFEIFYNDNKNLGYSKAYSILHDEQAAEDIEVLCDTVHEMDKGCIERI